MTVSRKQKNSQKTDNHSAEPPAKRRRASKACFNCRRRRIKCKFDVASGSCLECLASGEHCQVPEKEGRGGYENVVSGKIRKEAPSIPQEDFMVNSLGAWNNFEIAQAKAEEEAAKKYEAAQAKKAEQAQQAEQIENMQHQQYYGGGNRNMYYNDMDISQQQQQYIQHQMQQGTTTVEQQALQQSIEQSLHQQLPQSLHQQLPQSLQHHVQQQQQQDPHQQDEQQELQEQQQQQFYNSQWPSMDMIAPFINDTSVNESFNDGMMNNSMLANSFMNGTLSFTDTGIDPLATMDTSIQSNTNAQMNNMNSSMNTQMSSSMNAQMNAQMNSLMNNNTMNITVNNFNPTMNTMNNNTMNNTIDTTMGANAMNTAMNSMNTTMNNPVNDISGPMDTIINNPINNISAPLNTDLNTIDPSTFASSVSYNETDTPITDTTLIYNPEHVARTSVFLAMNNRKRNSSGVRKISNEVHPGNSQNEITIKQTHMEQYNHQHMHQANSISHMVPGPSQQASPHSASSSVSGQNVQRPRTRTQQKPIMDHTERIVLHNKQQAAKQHQKMIKVQQQKQYQQEQRQLKQRQKQQQKETQQLQKQLQKQHQKQLQRQQALLAQKGPTPMQEQQFSFQLDPPPRVQQKIEQEKEKEEENSEINIPYNPSWPNPPPLTSVFKADIVNTGVITVREARHFVSNFFIEFLPFYFSFFPSEYESLNQITSEPALMAVICAVGSRCLEPTEENRSIHLRLMNYCKMVISSMLWDCKTQSVRALVYAILIFCEWFPAGLLLENKTLVDCFSKHSRICWPLIGHTVRVVNISGLPTDDIHLSNAIRHTNNSMALRLGEPRLDLNDIQFELEYEKKIKTFSPIDRARLESLKWLDNANRSLFRSKEETSRVLYSGQYTTIMMLLDQLRRKWMNTYSFLYEEKTWEDRTVLFDFNYFQLYTFSMILIPWRQRATAEMLADLKEAQRYLDIATLAAQNIIVHEMSDTPLNIKNAPIHWFTRLIHATVFLSKMLITLPASTDTQQTLVRFIETAVHLMATLMPLHYYPYVYPFQVLCRHFYESLDENKEPEINGQPPAPELSTPPQSFNRRFPTMLSHGAAITPRLDASLVDQSWEKYSLKGSMKPNEVDIPDRDIWKFLCENDVLSYLENNSFGAGAAAF